MLLDNRSTGRNRFGADPTSLLIEDERSARTPKSRYASLDRV